MRTKDLLRRLDAHMERGDELMARNNELMAENRRALEENARAFRDLRSFLGDLTDALQSLTRHFAQHTDEIVAELRAQREALFRMLDRLDGDAGAGGR